MWSWRTAADGLPTRILNSLLYSLLNSLLNSLFFINTAYIVSIINCIIQQLCEFNLTPNYYSQMNITGGISIQLTLKPIRAWV